MIKPKWLTALFQVFAVTYRGQWTDALKSADMDNANTFIWMNSLKNFDENIINEAALLAVQNYNFPPSIQQFLEIVNTLARNKRMEDSGRKAISHRSFTTAPPSPLLQEYMDAHPLSPDDPFKLLFERYTGQELGEKVIALIKEKLKCLHPSN